jgi:hypothetical protein
MQLATSILSVREREEREQQQQQHQQSPDDEATHAPSQKKHSDAIQDAHEANVSHDGNTNGHEFVLHYMLLLLLLF